MHVLLGGPLSIVPYHVIAVNVEQNIVINLLMLGVCAPLVVLFDAFLLITSASFLSGFVT